MSYEETIIAHAVRILAKRMALDTKVEGKFSVSSDTGKTRYFHLVMKDITKDEPTEEDLRG